MIVTIVMTKTVRWRIPNLNHLFVVVQKLIVIFVQNKTSNGYAMTIPLERNTLIMFL